MNTSISELLNTILSKVKDIETKIVNQQKEIEIHMSKLSLTSGQIELLIAHIKSLKTSIGLLRDEIEEVHNLIGSNKI